LTRRIEGTADQFGALVEDIVQVFVLERELTELCQNALLFQKGILISILWFSHLASCQG
jgi:hypothetical protein